MVFTSTDVNVASDVDSSAVVLDSRRDFWSKLRQPGAWKAVQDYVRWQAERRLAGDDTIALSRVPDQAPISINLDLTSACNFHCNHCIDWDILNSGKAYDAKKLKNSLDTMIERGLKSVILIGGGEPTLYPGFVEVVKYLKQRDIQVAVVTNGTRIERVFDIAPVLGDRDWARLSLDAGSEEKFHPMHDPRGRMSNIRKGTTGIPITLDAICDNVKYTRERHPGLTIGFSYIVTGPGAKTQDRDVVSNIDDMTLAARRARDSDFSYFAVKAFLDRGSGGSEVVGEGYGGVWNSRMKDAISEIMSLETDSFKVQVATNLRAVMEGRAGDFKVQPANCHMTHFRQVMSLVGVVNCPGYRDEKSGSVIEGMDGYVSPQAFASTRISTARNIMGFNARTKCADVVCMYNPANSAIERLIEEEMVRPGSVDKMSAGPLVGGAGDYFL